MMNQVDMSQQLALDANGLNKLQRSARENSPEALKAVAEQFEALFLNMMLKSMREAGGGEGGIFDNEQSKMYTSMLDQQMTQSIASRGVGLADVLIRQLSPQHMAIDPHASAQMQPRQAKLQEAMDRMLETRPTVAASSSPSVKEDELSAAQIPPSDKPSHIHSFQVRMEPHAEAASRITGIPSKFILAQAALESGWGKREIVGTDGTRSHNVFGIKATGGWKGDVVETVTTEYVDGVAQRKVEKFRAYDSYADAFRDYAKLLSGNPRYQSVITQGQDAVGFATGLQRAGYATDPNYADKLTRIIRNNLG
jgi:flagellar protein FlgJ